MPMARLIRTERHRGSAWVVAPLVPAEPRHVRTMPDESRTNLEAKTRGVSRLESAGMAPSTPMQHERRSARIFWWFCALVAPPVAFATAASGYGMVVADPLRDIAFIVIASVAEEIIFRGAIQPALAGWFARRFARGREPRLLTPANAATSLLFAAFHLWGHPLAVAAAIFPVSLVYGRARELSGRTWPPASLHVYFNLLLYAASSLLASGR